MKFAYRFSNLLGTVYRKGNLSFTPDGNTVISPVGNRISLFDLKNNKSETLPVESELNFTAVALSPDGSLLIAVNEEGEALLISLRSRSLLHTYHFHRPVHAISFSPDGKKFAVTKENNVLLFHAPGKTKEFNPFVLQRTFYGAYDETVSIDWSTDSRVFCVGGKDMNTRVYGAQKFKNLIIYSMSGHTDCIVNAFFESNSLDLYTVGRNGQLCIWECDTELEGLIEDDGTKNEDDEEEDEMEEGEENVKKKKRKKEQEDEDSTTKIIYKRLGKYNFKEARGEGAQPAKVTSAAFHKKTHILCTGFSDGAFFLHEMPDFNLIHSLSISDQTIAAITFNLPGDWIALGCSGLGQLLVWEWQSESYVLKQQGHFNNMSCLEYSPDGQYVVTGGDDAKVKVWNTGSGFCFVTFSEHLGGITGVTFSQNGQVVLSCSLDGTVRAFDLNRYRNFRTFASPHPAQFSCLALDPSGEIVCAGGLDVFEIFVWSMQTGRLLEVLAGHEGPVSCLSFSPASPTLASASWDKTVRLWDVFEGRGSKEKITLLHDALAVSFRPDGKQLAVSSLDAQISFWDVQNVEQVGSIEGRHDLGYTRKEIDKITAKKSSFGKAFSSLCYTADGQCILAGGKSKNVCIYSVAEQILVKKFEITCNRSFDGTQEFLDRRKMTEFGSLSLVDEGQGDEDGKAISLPGVRHGDKSSRNWKPEVRVSGVRFSPTGREWAATTTEGLLIYSLDYSLVFDPFDLETSITPESVRSTLSEEKFGHALMLAFRLNEQPLIQEVMESIPMQDVEQLVHQLPEVYVDKSLSFAAGQLESSRHLEFYTNWLHRLLYLHGPKLKQRAQTIMPTLRTVQKNLTKKHQDLGKICDHNKYSIQYILSLAETKRKAAQEEPKDDADEADEDSGEEEDILGAMDRLDDSMEDAVDEAKSDTSMDGGDSDAEDSDEEKSCESTDSS